MSLPNNQTNHPSVTVIIPVRNGITFVEEAILSVLHQSFRDLELLLIDDGSNDADYSQFERLDPRLRLIRLEGFGVSHARNTGMDEARGQYIAFLDADDVWFPGKLAAQVRYLERHPNVGVVFGSFKKWLPNQSGQFTPAATLISDCSAIDTCDDARSGWLYTRLLTGLLVGMNTAVIRREVKEAIGGFNESMRQGEDYDFWLKASRIAEMHSLNATVALYRIHGASAMHRLSDTNQLEILLKAAAMRWGLTGPGNDSLSSEAFERKLSEIDFDHAYSHFWNGDRRIARRSFWRAMCRGHLPMRCAAYLALTFLPAGILFPQRISSN